MIPSIITLLGFAKTLGRGQACLAAAPGQDVTACELLRTYYPYQINFKLIKV